MAGLGPQRGETRRAGTYNTLGEDTGMADLIKYHDDAIRDQNQVDNTQNQARRSIPTEALQGVVELVGSTSNGLRRRTHFLLREKGEGRA